MLSREQADVQVTVGRENGGSSEDIVGHCPECGNPVLEFEDRFACVHTTGGSCSFSLDRDYLDWLLMVNDRATVEALLKTGESSYWFHSCDETPDYECCMRLSCSDDSRWYVEFQAIEQPNYKD